MVKKLTFVKKVKHTISLVIDEDNFTEVYKKHLSSRLLDNLSNEKVEKWVIREMKKRAKFHTKA